MIQSRMIQSRWFMGVAMAAGLTMGGGFAWAQGGADGVPGQPSPLPEQDQQVPNAGEQGMEACPMFQAQQSAEQAMQEGATVSFEETPEGAIIRVEAPAGDSVAIDDARTAAQQLAQAAQGVGGHGCGCPMMEGEAPATE